MTLDPSGSQGAAETFSRLQTLLVSVEGVDTFLQELSELATEIASPPVSVGITVEYDGHPLTVSSSDAWARQLDETQYQQHDGPCLQAMTTGEAIGMPDVNLEARWSEYLANAQRIGLQASVSLPLIVEGRSVGAVNFYSADHTGAFEGETRARAEVFAAQASTALLLAVRQLRQSKTNRQLEEALTSRSVIDQAIGILIAQQHCTSDEAFDLLRRHSQNNNRLLRDVAADLVSRTSTAED